MSLAQTQSALARLYTEAALRDRFFSDPPTAAATLGLDAGEAACLAGISPAEVGGFARSLRAKRLLDVGKRLPLTRAALGRRFAELFFSYADALSPTEAGRQPDEALAFALHLARALPGNAASSAWVLDLLRYETACLQAARLRAGVLVSRFRHPLPALAQGVPGPARTTLALWLRWPRGGRLRCWTVSLPSLC